MFSKWKLAVLIFFIPHITFASINIDGVVSISVPMPDDGIEYHGYNVKSVYERHRPDYKPINIKAGDFMLKPTMNLSFTHDDNIYASDAAKKEDSILRVSPRLDLESNWNLHYLKLTSALKWNTYTDYTDEDYTDYSFGIAGRYDITAGTFISTGMMHGIFHEERTSPDSLATGVEPNEFSKTNGYLRFTRDLAKLSLKTGMEATRLDFNDNKTASGTVLDLDFRDRDEFVFDAKLGYELSPFYEAFLKTSYNIKEYDNGTRNSNGYSAQVGADIDISGKVRGEVYIGYMSRDFDSRLFEDIDGFDADFNILWNITGITSIKNYISRNITESSIAGYSGYVTTAAGMSIEHEFKSDLLFKASLDYANHEYEGGSFKREDDVMGVGMELQYLVSRTVSATVSYEYEERDSNVAGRDYEKNAIMIGFRFGL